MSVRDNLLNHIESVKEKLTDSEYKNMIEELGRLSTDEYYEVQFLYTKPELQLDDIDDPDKGVKIVLAPYKLNLVMQLSEADVRHIKSQKIWLTETLRAKLTRACSLFDEEMVYHSNVPIHRAAISVISCTKL